MCSTSGLRFAYPRPRRLPRPPPNLSAGPGPRSGETPHSDTSLSRVTLKDDSNHGIVLRALKKLFARHVAEETPTTPNSRAPGQPAASVVATMFPPLLPQFEPVAAALEDDDTIIKRTELLLVHCPRNTKVLETLAQAYSRKKMFDESLSFYQRALQIAGGKNAALEHAIEETTLNKFDLKLSQIDAKAPDHAAQSERMQNQRLEYQWQTMEESPQKESHQSDVPGAPSPGDKTSSGR